MIIHNILFFIFILTILYIGDHVIDRLYNIDMSLTKIETILDNTLTKKWYDK